MLSAMVPSLSPRIGGSASLELPEHLLPCAAHGALVRGFPLGRMTAYGADLNVPDREILSGRRRRFRAGVQLRVDLLRLEGEADGRQGALLPLLFRDGTELGVHRLHFVRLPGYCRIEVIRGGLDP